MVVLGAAEVLAGVAIATATTPSGTAGLLTAALVLVLVVTAVLSRAWSLVGAAAAAAWLSVLQLRGDDVLHAPWFPVVVTALLLAGAELTHRLVRDDRWWVRTDWLLAAVAHGTAITALLAAGTGTSFALTYLAVGLLALTLAARLRRDVAVAGTYAVLGDGLVIAGAASAGSGWLALALAVTSVGCSVLAARASAVVRWTLLVAGAVTALAAWLSVASWLAWTPAQVVDRTVLLGAGITLLMAALLRWTAIDRTVVLVRGGLAAITATLTPLVPLVLHDERLAVTSATSAALAAVGLGLALAARPLGQRTLRYASPAYVLVAAAEAAYLLDATPAQQVAALALATLGCTIALLLPRRDAWADWRLPVLSLGITTSGLSVLVALTQLPDTTLLSAALLVAALMSMSIAVETRSLPAQLTTPVLVCAAWLVYAGRALDGNPQWYSVPIGLTLLVVVGLLRAHLRRSDQDTARNEVVLLELAGIGCLVVPSLVQAFTVALAYAALAAALGLLVAGWGVLTKVRRRVTAGVGVAIAALLVLVGVPLAQLLPAWSGVTLWVTIALVGLLAIVGATLLEKGRVAVRAGLDGFRELTEGWE
jgi:hypothetical protein